MVIFAREPAIEFAKSNVARQRDTFSSIAKPIRSFINRKSGEGPSASTVV